MRPLQRIVEDWASTAPSTYPNGTVFKSLEHMRNLADVQATLFMAGWRGIEPFCAPLLMLMELLRHPADANNDDTMQVLGHVRSELAQNGFRAEASIVQAAESDCLLYAAQNVGMHRHLGPQRHVPNSRGRIHARRVRVPQSMCLLEVDPRKRFRPGT